MRASCAWPDWLDGIWAKSPIEKQNRGESLAEHTWAVLGRTAELVRLRPALPNQVGMDTLWSELFWAAFLHDWGKIAMGFQVALRGGARWPHRHEVLSLAFVDWLGGSMDERRATWLATVICTHHKDSEELKSLYPLGLNPEDDPLVELHRDLPQQAVADLWRWLQIAHTWVDALGLTNEVAVPALPHADDAMSLVMESGIQAMSKWLRRSHRLVKDLTWEEGASLRIGSLLLRGYLVQADHAASAHAPFFGGLQLDRNGILRSMDVCDQALYEHQRKAGQADGSALLIAPTGSGKTEAALLWAARQVDSRGIIPRLFYTLPYQASMNAMYDRLQRFVGDRVGLLHGRSTLAIYRRLMDQNYTPDEANRLAKQMHNTASLNVLPVRVFSPYQMLKAAYQLKGYEAILADYAQGAFIFDEIHAYEPGRLAMILETMRYLRQKLGATFFVMSATLPAPVRQHLQEVLDAPTEITASSDMFRACTRHRVELLDGEILDESGVSAIVRAYLDGHQVLVTCNTVSRAQQMYDTLRSRLPQETLSDVVLIHGRFNGRDRVRKECGILQKAGLGNSARQPLIVVSTQVVEVSLNIDLDTLFSDPAPLEALVQRFGRVNRKRRVDLAAVHVFVEPADGQGIYDPAHIEATLQTLRDEATRQHLDEAALQGWLDGIYQGPILAAWEKIYAQTSQEFRAAFIDGLRPFNSDASLEESFDRLFDGLEVLPACLRSAYEGLKAERPLEASELLVPISWGRWHAIKRAKAVVSSPGDWPPIVDVPYSAETGLGSAQPSPPETNRCRILSPSTTSASRRSW